MSRYGAAKRAGHWNARERDGGVVNGSEKALVVVYREIGAGDGFVITAFLSKR